MARELLLFAGTANPALATAVASAMRLRLGACSIERFPDGEVSVRIDEPVRGREVCILQPTSPPVDANLIELLAFADAARRAAAGAIIAVVPYFGYGRADRRHGHREPITARLVGNLLEAAGVDHLLTVDLHTPQVEGFFHIPVDTISAVPVLARALEEHLPEDCVVVAPDAGRVDMATEYAGLLGASVAVLHKTRESGRETRVTRLVGEVEGRACLLVDDMVSTGGTVVKGVGALREAGAREFVVAATHGLLLGRALERMLEAGVREVFVSDTVARPRDEERRLRVVGIAARLGGALRELASAGSLAALR